MMTINRTSEVFKIEKISRESNNLGLNSKIEKNTIEPGIMKDRISRKTRLEYKLSRALDKFGILSDPHCYPRTINLFIE